MHMIAYLVLLPECVLCPFILNCILEGSRSTEEGDIPGDAPSLSRMHSLLVLSAHAHKFMLSTYTVTGNTLGLSLNILVRSSQHT